MKEYRDPSMEGGCYFHPKQVVVGVCSLCLHERLLTLLPPPSSSSNQRHQSSAKSIINLFALPSLFNPLHFLRHSSSSFDHNPHHPDTSTSQEDSFISIKFGDNGGGSWEDKNINVSNNKVVSLDHVPTKHKLKEGKSVVGHAKSRGSLRWRKRIGQVLQLIRWKKKKKKNKSNVEGVKVMRKHKHGWITNLTTRKTK